MDFYVYVVGVPLDALLLATFRRLEDAQLYAINESNKYDHGGARATILVTRGEIVEQHRPAKQGA